MYATIIAIAIVVIIIILGCLWYVTQHSPSVIGQGYDKKHLEENNQGK